MRYQTRRVTGQETERSGRAGSSSVRPHGDFVTGFKIWRLVSAIRPKPDN